MKYNELTISKQKSPTRVGRGIGGGKGKTAGRGTKGQGARKSSTKAGFEGGQMPLYMRLPKLRGFKSKKPTVENIYTGQLNAIKTANIDNVAVAEAGLVSSPYVIVKLVTKGDLTAKKTVKLQAASKSAVEMVQKAGGNFEQVARIGRESKS